MPRGDRTGPMGSGPMTGRGMGYCAGSTGPGFMSAGPGYGFGRRGGFGRGFRMGFGPGRGFGLGRGRGWRHPGFDPYNFAPLTEEQEMDALEEQAKMLEDELRHIKKIQAEFKKRKQETK